MKYILKKSIIKIFYIYIYIFNGFLCNQNQEKRTREMTKEDTKLRSTRG